MKSAQSNHARSLESVFVVQMRLEPRLGAGRIGCLAASLISLGMLRDREHNPGYGIPSSFQRDYVFGMISSQWE